jgi:hypothetical protein
MRSIYYFTANLLYICRVPFTHIMSTSNCSRRPLVQVIRHDRLDGVTSDPLESIYSQVANTIHYSQVNLIVVKCVTNLLAWINSHTVQPIKTYDLYQWSTITVSCTTDDGCKWHLKYTE